MCYFTLTVTNQDGTPLKGISVEISGSQQQQTNTEGKATFQTNLKRGSISVRGCPHAVDHPYMQDITIRI